MMIPFVITAFGYLWTTILFAAEAGGTVIWTWKHIEVTDEQLATGIVTIIPSNCLFIHFPSVRVYDKASKFRYELNATIPAIPKISLRYYGRLSVFACCEGGVCSNPPCA